MNLVAPFLNEAGRRATQVAIIDGKGTAVRFGELATNSAALAGAWQARGLKAGDRVLIAMGLGIELYVALAALWRIGAVAVLPEPALGLAGLRHAARTTEPKAFLANGWYRALGYLLPELWTMALRLSPGDRGMPMPDVATVDADHPALISFTSGTSGRPKAIARSHGFLAAQNACVADLLRPVGPEIDLVAFPVFVIVNLGLGVTSVLPNWNLRHHDKASPQDIVAHIMRHQVTRALLPPSVCALLADQPQLPKLNAIFTGGGPVFPDLLERLNAHLPDADIIAVYGSTEAEPIAHLHIGDIAPDDWQAMRSGAGLLAGRIIPEIGLTLIDDEIVVTGHHVNKGYLDSHQDASNKRVIDGQIWHRTGDAGRLDAQGRLWLLGRRDARVSAIYPFQVEVAARSWPGVRQAALATVEGRPVLALSGDRTQHVDWQRRASHFAGLEVVAIDALPLDRRHRSKIDYKALQRVLHQKL